MKSVFTVGLITGALQFASAAEVTCNTAPAIKYKPYVGPNGVEDPTGDLWCQSNLSFCGLACKGSVIANDCTRTKDDVAQTSTFCWSCTCADGRNPIIEPPPNGQWAGTIPTLTGARSYSNCMWEDGQKTKTIFNPYPSIPEECVPFYDYRNDAMNLLNSYMDETWTTVGSEPQPTTTSTSSTTTSAIITSSVTTTSEASTVVDSSFFPPSVSTTAVDPSATISVIEVSSMSATGSLTTMPTHVHANTTLPTTRKTPTATSPPPQFTGAGVMAAPRFAGIVGCLALLAAAL